MGSLQESMKEYQKQLKKDAITAAYQGLMKFFMGLRTHFKNTYPDYYVSAVYPGYMDVTFFSFYSKPLKERGLKIILIFDHDAFRFEVWLAGFNKQVQSTYWQIFKDSGWDEYHVVPAIAGVDAIVAYSVVEDPDFDDLATLTKQIESGAAKFVKAVERFLSAIKI
jgi:hypothetical protein